LDSNPTSPVEYAGFWLRFWASVIDTVLVLALTTPLLYAIYGAAYFETTEAASARPAEVLITWIAPAVACIWFWLSKQATPGKMALSMKVVDADTLGPLSVSQSVGRYGGYFLSLFGLGLGFLWVAFDARKQGWHDKVAGTVVVRTRARPPTP